MQRLGSQSPGSRAQKGNTMTESKRTEWSFTQENGDERTVGHDTLFDADAFQEYLFAKRLWISSVQRSSGSNSHYFSVSFFAANDTEQALSVLVSDHCSAGHFRHQSVPDVVYADMPTSQEPVFASKTGRLSHVILGWKSLPGITWNVQRHWAAVIAEIDRKIALLEEMWAQEEEKA